MIRGCDAHPAWIWCMLMLGHLLGKKHQLYEASCVVLTKLWPVGFLRWSKMRGAYMAPHSRPKKHPLSRIFWYEDALHMSWRVTPQAYTRG
jgi:hypothetical protein